MSYINEIHIFLAGERLVGYVSRENSGKEAGERNLGAIDIQSCPIEVICEPPRSF